MTPDSSGAQEVSIETGKPSPAPSAVTALSSGDDLRDLSELTLQQAADVLGLHYMTVYRYVRTGRLQAFRRGGEWRVTRHALLQLRASGARGKPGRNPAGTRSWPTRFRNQLLEGDEAGAWAVIQDALASGMSPAQFHLEVLTPTLQYLGSQWLAGQLSIATEHRASAIAQRLVGRMGPQFVQRGRKRGHVILGAPADDHHSLPVAMFADLLRSRNFRVSDLGANVPADSFVDFVEQRADVAAAGIGATLAGNEENIAKLVAALQSQQGIPVVLGGAAIPSAEVAQSLGADAWSAPGEAGLETFVEVASFGRIPGQRDLDRP